MYLTNLEQNNKESLPEFNKLLAQTTESKTHLSKNLGRGTLEVIDIADGIYVRIWDCRFNTKIHLQCKPEETERRMLTLVYYLCPETFVVQKKNQPGVQVSKIWNNILLSNNAEFNMDILPGMPLRCFAICFTPEWIQRNIGDNMRQNEFVSNLFLSNEPVFLFESYTSLEEKMVLDIFAHQSTGPMSPLFIRSRVFTLVCSFINKVASRRSLLAPVNADLYESNIRGVEEKLQQYFHSSLPSLRELAREFALSESTLKRNFKKAFEKSIHDYYLEKKMAYAKQLIEEKNKTVTETAYMLGYEKVSHFISIFKKYIGCLPGALRRENSYHMIRSRTA